MTTVVIQVSDTHFGTERRRVLEALIRLVRRERPSVVVLSGDVTQRARRRQFEAAERFCRDLEVPRVLSIPGNHDIPLFNPLARLLHPYRNYCRALGTELEPEYASEELLVVCVNTTRAYRHKNGEVSREQVDRVANRLRRATPRQLCVVVTHQPVLVIEPSDQANLLIGAEHAVRAWARAGADIVMGGHIHLPYVRPLSERVAGLPRRLWVVQAGTAVSRRVRGGLPNSVNVLRYAPSGAPSCRVERWDYLEPGGFAEVETRVLDLDRADRETRRDAPPGP